jgi:predicted ATP-grasp superfamily ATP-dependent carboligase
VTLYEIDDLDDLVAPVLIVAFEGWISAGSAGTAAADHLAGDGRVVARFDSDELIDYRANRPTVDIMEGVITDVGWPDITIRRQTIDGRDLLLLTGPEPDRLWKQMAAEIAELVGSLGVVEQITLGGIPWAAPHTRPTALIMTASRSELLDPEIGHAEGLIRVPGAAANIIAFQLMDRGIPVVGFFARVPHYVAGTYYPAVVALVDRVATHLGIAVPAGSVVDEAAEQRQRLDELLEDQPQAAAIVRRLEDLADSSGDVSGTELAAEIERYLEQQTNGEEGFPDDIG